MTAFLYEPDQDEDTFALTPDYDAALAEYANLNPEDPDPRMGDRPEFHFENYLRMVNPPKAVKRGKGGRFVSSKG